MLRDSPLDVVLLATDLVEARDFYADKLGLPVLDESEHSLTFGCGGGSRLIISKSDTGTADTQTQAQWRVQDLAAELADLRSRGVKIEDYDEPGFRTEDGIYDAGSALFAWITDPAKNSLALLQYK
jgi:catechol 2,3-dioxygenase-like lactoylglutathione lyase family enzyme